MHDRTKVTLTDVRHVPDLKKNLISIDTLEAKGCKYSAKDGVLTVTKDDCFVMSARRSGSLYILQGNKVTGVSAGCSARSEQQNRPPSR